MDIHGLTTFLPLLGLTAGWRGVRIGGKTLGMGGGLGSSNSSLVQAFDKAKAEGDRAAMERIAKQMNETRLKQKQAKAPVKTGAARLSNDRAGQYDPNVNLSLEQRTNLANEFLAKGGKREFIKAADKHANGQVREYWKKGNYVDSNNRLWARSSNGKDFLLIGQYDASGKIQFDS